MAALSDMAAERRRAADLDGPHDAELFPRKPVSFPVLRAVLPEDAGQLRSWPRHDAYRPAVRFRLAAFSGSASSGLAVRAIRRAETAV